MIHLELRVLCELDGVEGVHLAAAAAAAKLRVQQQPELALAAAQCEVFPGELLEVLVLAGGVEHGHLGLDREQQTLSVADPAPLGITPGCAGVCPEHVPSAVP